MKDNYSEQKIRPKEGSQISFSDGLFYEIEYDSTPMKGVGKYVLKSQSIKAPEKDEIRELFHRMRDIARQNRPTNLNYSKFYDKRVQQDNSISFYKQAVFMKDYEDHYLEETSFSGYFPYYQMLSYEQLRTYFSWRTQVRQGNVQSTSLSYVFLYLYELINNIGLDSPKEGLEHLLTFWVDYKEYDASLDKYVIRWLKDYHIYYNLPHRFKDFVKENNLSKHFPKMADHDDSFNLYCSISKYDISKSAFFTDETRQLIIDCFNVVIVAVRQKLEMSGIHVDDELFCPTKKITTWKPFKDALFFQWYNQPNKKVVFSENEIYICNNNEWTFSSMITSETGKQFVGYIMKQMESVLRKIRKYKFKIKVEIDMLSAELRSKLNQSGLSIEKIIETAVMEFYREMTKTVVTVDHGELNRIRQEALSTQEALIVEEQGMLITSAGALENSSVDASMNSSVDAPVNNFFVVPVNNSSDAPVNNSNDGNVSNSIVSPVNTPWARLRDVLSDREVEALALIMEGASIKSFVDKHNIMLEVLLGDINEKAFDTIGDNILDDEQALYEEYREQVKEMVE